MLILGSAGNIIALIDWSVRSHINDTPFGRVTIPHQLWCYKILGEIRYNVAVIVKGFSHGS